MDENKKPFKTLEDTNSVAMIQKLNAENQKQLQLIQDILQDSSKNIEKLNVNNITKNVPVAEEIADAVEELIAENRKLKETLVANSTFMKEQFTLLTKWRDHVHREFKRKSEEAALMTNDSFRFRMREYEKKLSAFMNQISRLTLENQNLKMSLSASEEKVSKLEKHVSMHIKPEREQELLHTINTLSAQLERTERTKRKLNSEVERLSAQEVKLQRVLSTEDAKNVIDCCYWNEVFPTINITTPFEIQLLDNMRRFQDMLDNPDGPIIKSIDYPSSSENSISSWINVEAVPDQTVEEMKSEIRELRSQLAEERSYNESTKLLLQRASSTFSSLYKHVVTILKDHEQRIQAQNIDLVKSRNLVETCKNQLMDRQKRISSVESEHEDLKKKADELLRENKALRVKIKTIDECLMNEKESKASCNERKARLEKELKTLRERNGQLEKQLMLCQDEPSKTRNEKAIETIKRYLSNMANLLKKRALAEYSSAVIQEEPPAKKFKCVLKPSVNVNSSYALVSLLGSRTSSYDALQLLLRIAEALNFEEDEVPDVISKLSQHYRFEKESPVRVVILSCFADIGQSINDDLKILNLLIEETIELLKSESSHKVLNQGLLTLLRLSRLVSPLEYGLRMKLISQAKERISDTSPSVKCRCFDIFGELVPVCSSPFNDEDMQTQTLKILGDYIHNEDARTRSCAFNNMITLHNRGLKLDPSIYSEACIALKDDYEMVRVAALKLIWLLSITYPENIVKSSNSEGEIRLIDDAFGNICSSITDLSMRVRTESAQLLGTMTEVSLPILLQTLDKSLMSDMRKKASAHERAIESMNTGAWMKGKSLPDRRKEHLEEDKVNIMRSGAYGAFVHGLEDDFLEVRNASIDSISLLSVRQPNFAVVALDFLVDMFNDDIQEVRVKAINRLCMMKDHIEFREDQLETILGLLEDNSIDVREGLQRILASCKFVTKDCLQMCVDTLFSSMKKYPQDKKSIWNCFHKMGSLHASLTLPLVPELLSIHPFFDTSEQIMDDPAYVSLLLLIFNAAQHCTTIIQLLEEKTIKHYSYLRDTMPHLVPYLPLSSTLTSKELKAVPTTATVRFMDTMTARLENAANERVLAALLRTAADDLERLSRMDSEVAGAARFQSLYINSQLLFDNLVKQRTWYSAAMPEQHSLVREAIRILLKNAVKMQHLFMGLNSDDIAAIKQFKLKALALLLVYVVKATNQSARSLCHHFVGFVDDVNSFLRDMKGQSDQFANSVIELLSQVEEAKPGPLARTLLPLLLNSKLSPPPKPNLSIKMCHAVINSPMGGADTTYKFTAGLVMAVPLDAEISNLCSTKPLRLRLKYPDQQTHLIVPRHDHLRPNQYYTDTDHMYRLITTALISHQVWSEACFVELSLVLDLTDTEGSISHAMQPLTELCVIGLCEPVKLYVSPKQVRRGI